MFGDKVKVDHPENQEKEGLDQYFLPALIEYSRHRSVTGFTVNQMAGLAAYSFFPKKPMIDEVCEYAYDNARETVDRLENLSVVDILDMVALMKETVPEY